MSHWQKGKLKTKCAIGVMEKIILGIMPKWKEHIKVDPSGNLEIYNSYTKQKEKGYNIVIPQGVTGIRWGDLGLKQEKDGSWGITADPGGLPHEVRNFEGRVGQEYGKLKLQAIAKAKGLRIVSERMEGGKLRVQLIAPVKEQHKIYA